MNKYEGNQKLTYVVLQKDPIRKIAFVSYVPKKVQENLSSLLKRIKENGKPGNEYSNTLIFKYYQLLQEIAEKYGVYAANPIHPSETYKARIRITDDGVHVVLTHKKLGEMKIPANSLDDWIISNLFTKP